MITHSTKQNSWRCEETRKNVIKSEYNEEEERERKGKFEKFRIQ